MLVITITCIKVVIDYKNYKVLKYWSLQLYVQKWLQACYNKTSIILTWLEPLLYKSYFHPAYNHFYTYNFNDQYFII
jgi:hypothetical protein